eukprot:gene42277-61598_t
MMHYVDADIPDFSQTYQQIFVPNNDDTFGDPNLYDITIAGDCDNMGLGLSGGKLCRRLDANEMLWFIARIRSFRWCLWTVSFVGMLVFLFLTYFIANPVDPAMMGQAMAGMQPDPHGRCYCGYITEPGGEREKNMVNAMARGFPNASNFRYFGQLQLPMMGMQPPMGMPGQPGMPGQMSGQPGMPPGMPMMPGMGPRRHGSQLRVVLVYGWSCASVGIAPFIVREMFYYWEMIEFYKKNTTGELQKFWNDFDTTQLGLTLWLAILSCWPLWLAVTKIALFPFCYVAKSGCAGMPNPMGGDDAAMQPQGMQPETPIDPKERTGGLTEDWAQRRD